MDRYEDEASAIAAALGLAQVDGYEMEVIAKGLRIVAAEKDAEIEDLKAKLAAKQSPTVSSIYDDERLFHDYYAASLSHPTDNSPQKTADEAVKEHRKRFPRHESDE